MSLSFVRPVVLAVFAELPRPGRDDGRARSCGGSCHHLAQGTALCTLLNQRLRRELRWPNASWRVDETYIKVAGTWTYLYRAVDSAGDTIEFMLSPKRDLTAARQFLRLALSGTDRIRPRVINVDGHPAYARTIAELKQSGELGRRRCCRPSPYLNNVIEQDHRFIKKRIVASLGFRSAEGAWRTIEGYEAMHLIRKGQIRWLPKGDVIGQRQFIHTLSGVAA
jgi:transposase, IS6 family